MQQVTMHDLEISSNWMENRQTGSHWYNPYNPLIKIDLVETSDKYTADNERVGEIQFNVKVQQLRLPQAHEFLLMGMSDTLLRKLQRLITWFSYEITDMAVSSKCETVTITIDKLFGQINQYSCLCLLSMDSVTDKNFIGYVRLVRSKWMMAQLVNPFMEFRLVLTLIHNELHDVTMGCMTLLK